MCKVPPVEEAKTAPVPAQQPREASLDVEVTQIEWGLHDHLPESRDILGPVNSARGGLVREVSPVEEPAESAVKERQCVRYHRLKKRGDSASTRATAKVD